MTMNTFTMNRFSFALPLALLASANALAQAPTGNIAVNATGTAPAATAILDVSSTTKGMFIPRMTYAQRTAIVGPVAGLTVYQTDVVTVLTVTYPDGFWYYDAVAPAAWVPMSKGGNAWDIAGNALNAGTPAADYFGTNDGKDVVFKTLGLERMRLKNTGFLGIGNAAPVELLEVGGAARIYYPTGGPIFAATQQQGVIKFHPTNVIADTAKSTLYTYNGIYPIPAQPILWSGHYGNVDGTSPILAGSNPLPGSNTNNPNWTGWRRLENDYDEVPGANYTQQGEPTCGAGSVEIPNPGTIPLTYTRTLTAAQREYISPFLHNSNPPTGKRWRQQFMFLQGELNTELNQINGVNGTPSPNSTNGLGTCQPITSIGFWVDTAVVAALEKTWTFEVSIKHAPLGVNNLFAGFDLSTDPAGACVASAILINQPAVTGAPSWVTFTFGAPFVWDGVRNIIIEVAVQTAGAQLGNRVLPVKYSVIPGVSPANQLTYAVVVPSANWLTVPCNPAAATVCSVAVVAANLPSVAACATTAGSINLRPVVKFTGGITTAPVATTSTGSYLIYRGGFISEATTGPVFPWGRMLTNIPTGQPYNVFKGPGNIAAETGVYDNGVQLSDHVFDRAFDGRVNPKDAGTFGVRRNLSIAEMSEYTRTNRHLPTMKGRESWKREGSFSLGDLTNQLWATTETQALYVTQLHDRMNVLELLSDNRPIHPNELPAAKAAVAAMSGLTEQEKAALIKDLTKRTTETEQPR